MSAVSYTFVPFTGDRTTNVADLSQFKIVENEQLEGRLADRMVEAGIDAPVWLTQNGVIVGGSKDHVRGVTNIVTQPSFLLNSGEAPAVASAFSRAAEVVSFRAPQSKPSIMGGYRHYDIAA